MFSRGKSTDRGRKVTPPSPTYMTNEQFASYLAELRRNRLSRPGGAREQPAGPRGAKPRHSICSANLASPPTPTEAQDTFEKQRAMPSTQSPAEPTPRTAIQTSSSVRSRYSMAPSARDYYPEKPATPLKPSEVVPSSTYIERGQRWMEKEEAYSLRHAMEEMDIKEGAKAKNISPDDQQLYEAALQEASELVWQHQSGEAPKPGGPYRYRPHLRKNSYAHARTASVGKYGDEIRVSGLARDGSRSVSGSSTDSDGCSRTKNSTVGEVHNTTQEFIDSRPPIAKSKPYNGISGGNSTIGSGRRRSSTRRNISGELERPFSGDQIWEEPKDRPSPLRSQFEAEQTPCVLESKGRNPLNRVHFTPMVDRANKVVSMPGSTIDIHRNPTTQSRNPSYITNSQSSSPGPTEEATRRKNGVEVRADDIREATSMRLKDRSEKLPTPSAVSDNPGRPIVSFDANWTPPEDKTDRGAERSRAQASTPIIPSIVVGEDSSLSSSSRNVPVPSITVDEGRKDSGGRNTVPSIVTTTDDDSGPSGPSANASDIPVIVTPEDGRSASARPLPQPGSSSRTTDRRAKRSRAQIPPAGLATGRAAQCHECGFPIQGRFVALAGAAEKFHPQCFACYSCGTGLEALEISPEPDHFRRERLDRIRRRAAGEALDEAPGKTMAEDGDERLRFYCHLDWHELFAPRCKHCKTPILGEHIVALGEHWHYGHFFCAECGDPFEQGMTHIEKDGYAWCVSCQTKRTERRAPKCKKCRLAVVGHYIQALGSDWHEHCFRCATCDGAFDDGQVFPKESGSGCGSVVVLCTGCRARELKQ